LTAVALFAEFISGKVIERRLKGAVLWFVYNGKDFNLGFYDYRVKK